MDMEHPSALFVLARMADRVHFIARSNVEGVNSGVIAEQLGGGGHSNAASATIKDMTLTQSIDALKEAISETLEGEHTAREMMIEQVITADVDQTISEVESIMTRFDVNSLPVMENARPVGIVTRQIIEKAIYHNMADKAVSDFMITEFTAVYPDTPVGEIEDIILGARQKLAPVVSPEDGTLAGVISRGMILNKLYGDSLKEPSYRRASGKALRNPLQKNVTNMMRERLPETVLELFRVAARVADECGYPLYVAGGFVRDFLLRTPTMDIDLVVEGDGIVYAHHLAKELNGRTHPHHKFKTAVVTLPDGLKLDVATARIEYYAGPAALPTVESGAMRNDLYRRDFSINAMAIRLNGDKPNMLVDYFGGQADLKDHVVRVLHNLSFVEDPTRAFRAVRFSHRLGFSIGKQTQALLKNAVLHQLFNRLSGDRLFAELKMILNERRPGGAVLKMEELGLLRFIHTGLDYNESIASLLDRCEELIAWHSLTFPDQPVERWKVYMMALLDQLNEKGRDEMASRERFAMSHFALRGIGEGISKVKQAIAALMRKPDIKPADIYKLFEPLCDEDLLFLAAKAKNDKARSAMVNYLTKLKNIKPYLTGKDLGAIGVAPSKEMGDMLDQLFTAQLNGDVGSKKEALEIARGM